MTRKMFTTDEKLLLLKLVSTRIHAKDEDQFALAGLEKSRTGLSNLKDKIRMNDNEFSELEIDWIFYEVQYQIQLPTTPKNTLRQIFNKCKPYFKQKTA